MSEQVRYQRKNGWVLTRRSFLIASGSTATIGVAADPQASPVEDAPDDKRKVVFKDTEHIRTYYTLARR